MNERKRRVVAIVPARAGSKRVPRKNVRLLGGKPLFHWAIEAAQAARLVDEVVVSSDDAEVLSARALFPNVHFLARPAELASDTAPAIAYVQHVVAEREKSAAPITHVVIVQPTSPFTLGSDIDETVRVLLSTGAESAVTVMVLDHAIHPVKMKVLDGDRLLPYLEDEKGRMAAHELPMLYVRNCSVYVSTRATLDDGKIIGDDCRAVVMPRERSIDINDELDFAFAEFLVERTVSGSKK